MSGLGLIGEGDIKPCLGFIITESDCFLRKYNCSICRPRKIENIPELQMHFIRTIKRFERLTVEAIREKSRKKAIEALMIYPLVNSYPIAAQLVDELLDVYEVYVGHWS